LKPDYVCRVVLEPRVSAG